MIRQAPCLLLRSIPHRLPPPTCRRLLSTAPPAQKRRSWNSSTARWGLVIGALYYLNTSDLFAEEPPFSIPPPQNPTEETSLPTLESIAPKRTSEPPTPQPPSENTNTTGSLAPVNEGLEATEEQAGQEGAYDEETGEINWDCPCLGGMAHGPCGEQFRAAFSCFIYSKEEPKGMDCIDNFKNMQTCFREYPDVYGAELEDDEESEMAPVTPEGSEVPAAAALSEQPKTAPVTPEGGEIPAAATSTLQQSQPPSSRAEPPTSSPPLANGNDTQRAKAAKEHVEKTHPEATSESDELVPKAAHDARNASTRD